MTRTEISAAMERISTERCDAGTEEDTFVWYTRRGEENLGILMYVANEARTKLGIQDVESGEFYDVGVGAVRLEGTRSEVDARLARQWDATH